MKKLTICFYVTLLLTISAIGQNPLPALKEYQYETDNNDINLDKEFEDTWHNVSFMNVFFTYFKNHQYNQTFQSDKIMLFRVQYENVIQTVVDNNPEINFNFRCNNKFDKLTKLKFTSYSQGNGKTISKKLKKSDYEVITTDSIITIRPNPSVLVPGNVLRIFCSIESTDLTLINLSPLNKIENSTHFVAFNVPEIFNYLMEIESLELIKQTTREMKLIKFEYDVSRLHKIITS